MQVIDSGIVIFSRSHLNLASASTQREHCEDKSDNAFIENNGHSRKGLQPIPMRTVSLASLR